MTLRLKWVDLRFMFIKEWFIDVNYICKIVCIPGDYLKNLLYSDKAALPTYDCLLFIKKIQGKHTVYFFF